MKVLVTGGLGYLGSIMVKRLLEEGHSVRVLDSLIYRGPSKRERSAFELVTGDVRDCDLLQKATEDVDAVIHLAGIIGDTAADLSKDLTLEINCKSTKRLAELCAKRNLRLVFSSTCSVYGAEPKEVITERSRTGPLSLYASSKLMAEEDVRKTCDNSVVFRLGTLFGLSPRMRFDLVINRFIAQAIQDGMITVFGGHQRRPFVHIEDVACVFVKAIDASATGLYNVGGANYNILDAANVLKKKTGCAVKVLIDSKDPRDYAVDSCLAEKTFAFHPRRNIDFAVDEIQSAYSRGVIKDYREPIFNNEAWLRRAWQQTYLLQAPRGS